MEIEMPRSIGNMEDEMIPVDGGHDKIPENVILMALWVYEKTPSHGTYSIYPTDLLAAFQCVWHQASKQAVAAYLQNITKGGIMWNYRKIGGLRFLRIGRVQFSFCVCRRRLA